MLFNKTKDTTPKVFTQGFLQKIDTSKVPEGMGAAFGYCRTDWAFGSQASTREFAETQIDDSQTL